MNSIEGTTMLMNMSRAIAAAAAGAIVLGAVGLASAADVGGPDYPQAPEAYQYGNPPPPPGYGYPAPPPAYGYPPPPAVYGYPAAPPPVVYGYPPPVPPAPIYRGPRYYGPVYGGYGYRRYAYGVPPYAPRDRYWAYRRHW
jgi:hypothetical protein